MSVVVAGFDICFELTTGAGLGRDAPSISLWTKVMMFNSLNDGTPLHDKYKYLGIM